jgi:GNAT superfamily N-acetyltransferase
MHARNLSVTYGIVKTIKSSMTYFKIKSNELNGNDCLEGYVSDIDNPELPGYIESMGSDPESIFYFVGKYNTIGIICNLFVEADHRGHGIGADLVASAIDEFYTLNVGTVIVVPDIHTHNPHLHNGLEYWYEDRGFKTIASINSVPLMAFDLKNYQVERL